MLKPFLNVKYQPDNNGVIPKFYGSLSAIWVGICTSINGMEDCSFSLQDAISVVVGKGT